MAAPRLPLLLLVLALVTVPLAGCVTSEPPATESTTDAPDSCVNENVCGADAIVDEATGRDLRLELTAEDVLDVPTWQVGDVFEQHIYYGSADTAGEHIVTMVTADDGGCYTFGTTSSKAAAFEAAFDLPFLGCVNKDLTTTGFDNDWTWMYDFPLSDGKSWSGSIEAMYNWNLNVRMYADFTLTANYEERINVNQLGDFPGFVITGVLEDGQEILRYNYVPAIGWFSHFWLYDIQTPEDGDIVLHMMSMGTSDRYTGPYFIDEGTTLVDALYLPPFVTNGEHVTTFVVPEGTSRLMGFVVPISCPGRSEVVVTDPTNQADQYTHEYPGDPADCTDFDSLSDENPEFFTVHQVDQENPAPGEYRAAAAWTGVGGYYLAFHSIVENEYELTEADLPAAEEA